MLKIVLHYLTTSIKVCVCVREGSMCVYMCVCVCVKLYVCVFAGVCVHWVVCVLCIG